MERPVYPWTLWTHLTSSLAGLWLASAEALTERIESGNAAARMVSDLWFVGQTRISRGIYGHALGIGPAFMAVAAGWGALAVDLKRAARLMDGQPGL